jgi:hypothetical protein
MCVKVSLHSCQDGISEAQSKSSNQERIGIKELREVLHEQQQQASMLWYLSGPVMIGLL